jgi:tetratricopeptide (TPR) repeat protein
MNNISSESSNSIHKNTRRMRSEPGCSLVRHEKQSPVSKIVLKQSGAGCSPRTSTPETRVLCIIALLLLLGLTTATYQRNRIWQNGITLWEDVVNKNPEKAESFAQLAAAHELADNTNMAISYYQASINLNPNIPGVHNNLGIIYRKLGFFDNAIAQHLAALELDPTDAQVHNNIANDYLGKGQVELSVEHYRAALNLKPDFVEAHYNLGIAYEAMGATSEAMESYRAVLRFNPGNVNAEQKLKALQRSQIDAE